MNNLTITIFVMLIIIVQLPAPAGHSQEFEDTLAFYMEEAEVVTASRKKQKVSESPVTIDVITAAEIKATGAQNIWDVLRYRLGVDVMEMRAAEGNRAAVSVRGLIEEFTLSLLVMLDGRSIMSQMNGGTFWNQIPVQLEEIERIEIVRGPNSALFGSNAGYGVINIISKVPDKASGFEIGFVHGNPGVFVARAVSNIVKDKTRFRLSVKRRTQGSYPANPEYLDKENAEDNWISSQINLKTEYKLGEHTLLEGSFGGLTDYYRSIKAEKGVNIGDSPRQSVEQHFEVLKLSHEFESGDSLEFSAAFSDHFWRSVEEDFWQREQQIDGELLYRMDLLQDRLQTVSGVSYRFAQIKSPVFLNLGQAGFGAEEKNRIRRAFVSTTGILTPWLSTAASASVEHSDTGKTQFAFQGSFILRPLKNHRFRISASRSPNLPSISSKYADMLLKTENIMNLFNVNVFLTGNPEVVPVQIISYEASLQGNYFDNRLGFEMNVFETHINNLSDFEFYYSDIHPIYMQPQRLDIIWVSCRNIVTRGFEFVTNLKSKTGNRLQVSYAYMDVEDPEENRYLLESTPYHRVKGGIILKPLADLTLSGHVSYVTSYWSYTSFLAVAEPNYEVIPEHVRLDLHASWQITDQLEIFAAGQNMLTAAYSEFGDGILIPQTWQTGINVRF